MFHEANSRLMERENAAMLCSINFHDNSNVNNVDVNFTNEGGMISSKTAGNYISLKCLMKYHFKVAVFVSSS